MLKHIYICEMDQLNARVLYLMEVKSLSKSQLARILEISPSIMSHIASGRNKVGVEVLQKLIDAFPDISASWLLTGNGSMKGDENLQNYEEVKRDYHMVLGQLREVEADFDVLKRKMVDLERKLH